jgi:hypothetical protein
VCFADGYCLESDSSGEGLEQTLVAVRAREPQWKAPPAVHLSALLRLLSERGRLVQMLERQRDSAAPGLPDLALYRRAPNGRPYGVIFAEVKRTAGKWREPLSPAQRSELSFLRALGFKAGVVRVVEGGTVANRSARPRGRRQPSECVETPRGG